MNGLDHVQAYNALGVGPDQLWLGSADSLIAMRSRVDEFFLLDADHRQFYEQGAPQAGFFRGGDDDDDEDNKPFEEKFEFMRRVERVAVMEVSGSLSPKPSFWSWITGAADYQSMRAAAAEAALDPGIEAMVMDIDSPGGAVAGCALTGQFLASIDRNDMPILACTSSMACSAAYWLGVSARSITASQDAEVGSIGAITVHMDYTKMLAERGIKPTVFRSGPYKALGSPVEALDERATKELQNKIDAIGANFGRYVASRRGLDYEANVDTLFNGREFFGAQALALGLVDGHATTEQTVVRLNEQAEAQFGAPAPGPGQVTHAGA